MNSRGKPPRVHCNCWWVHEDECCQCGNNADSDGLGLCSGADICVDASDSQREAWEAQGGHELVIVSKTTRREAQQFVERFMNRDAADPAEVVLAQLVGATRWALA